MATTDGYMAALYYGDKDDGTSATWTEVTGVTEVTPPEASLDDIETKHLKTADHTKTFKAGWRDYGEVSATVQYDATQYGTLAGFIGTTKDWKVLFADDTTAETHDGSVQFIGYIKSMGTPVDADGLVTVTLTIKVSGKPSVIAADTTSGT